MFLAQWVQRRVGCGSEAADGVWTLLRKGVAHDNLAEVGGRGGKDSPPVSRDIKHPPSQACKLCLPASTA